MRFYRDFNSNQSTPDHEPLMGKPVPMRPKDNRVFEESERSADLKMVARRLGISRRHVPKACAAKSHPGNSAWTPLHTVRSFQRPRRKQAVTKSKR